MTPIGDTLNEAAASFNPKHALESLKARQFPQTYKITLDGQEWTVACDTFRVLLVAGGEAAEREEGFLPESLKGTITGSWAVPLEYPCFATIPQLLAFGGERPPRVTCPRCGDEVECVSCLRKGRKAIGVNYVQYQGEAFNWDMARDILADLVADQVVIARTGQMLRVETLKWKYWQMAVFATPESRAGYADLTAYLAGGAGVAMTTAIKRQPAGSE